MAIISDGGANREGILRAISDGKTSLPALRVDRSTVQPARPAPVDLLKALNLPAAQRREPDSGGGLVGAALKILDITRTAPSSFLKETFDLFQGEGWSARDFWNQTTSHYGFGDLIRDERDSVATMLALTSPFNFGIGAGLAVAVKSENIWADRIIGGIGDLSLDVLTYMGGVPAILRNLGRAGTIRHLGQYTDRLNDLVRMVKSGSPQAAKEATDAFAQLGIKSAGDAENLAKAAGVAKVAAAEKKSLSGAIRALGKTDDGQRVARHVGLEAGVRLRMPGTGSFGRVLRQDKWLDATARTTARVLGRDPSKAGLYQRLSDAVVPFQQQMYPRDVLQNAVKVMRDSRRFGAAGKAAKEAADLLPDALRAVAGRAARAPAEFVVPAITKRGAQGALLANMVARAADAPIRATDRLTPNKLQDRLRPLFSRNADMLNNLYMSGDADKVLIAAHFEPAFRRALGAEQRLGSTVGQLEEFLNFGQKAGLTVQELNRVFPDLLDSSQAIFGSTARTDGFIELGRGSALGSAAVAEARAAGRGTVAGRWFDELPDRIKDLDDETLFNLLKRLDDWRVDIDGTMARTYGVPDAEGRVAWDRAERVRLEEGMDYSGPRSILDENTDLIYGAKSAKKLRDEGQFDPIVGRRPPGSTEARGFGPGRNVLLNVDAEDQIFREVSHPHFIAKRLVNGKKTLVLLKPERNADGVIVGYSDFKPVRPDEAGKSVRRQIDEVWQEAFGRPLYEPDFTRQWTAWSRGMGRDVRVYHLLKYMEQHIPAIRDDQGLIDDVLRTVGESETHFAATGRRVRGIIDRDAKLERAIRKNVATAQAAIVARGRAKAKGFVKEQQIESAFDQQAALLEAHRAIGAQIADYQDFLMSELALARGAADVSLEDLTSKETLEELAQIGDLRTEQITMLSEVAMTLEQLKQVRSQLADTFEEWERFVRLEVGNETGPISDVLRARLAEVEALEAAHAQAKATVDNAARVKQSATAALADMAEEGLEPELAGQIDGLSRRIRDELVQVGERGDAARAERSAFDLRENMLQEVVDEVSSGLVRAKSRFDAAEETLGRLRETQRLLAEQFPSSGHADLINQLKAYAARQQEIVDELEEALNAVQALKPNTAKRKRLEAYDRLSKARAKSWAWGLDPYPVFPPTRAVPAKEVTVETIEQMSATTAGLAEELGMSGPELQKRAGEVSDFFEAGEGTPTIRGGTRFADPERLAAMRGVPPSAVQRLERHQSLLAYREAAEAVEDAVGNRRDLEQALESKRGQVAAAARDLAEYRGRPKGKLVHVTTDLRWETGALGPFARNVTNVGDRLFAISKDGRFGILEVRVPKGRRLHEATRISSTADLPEQQIAPRTLQPRTPAFDEMQRLRSLTKRDLVGRARALGIVGRDRMSKEQLVTEVARRSIPEAAPGGVQQRSTEAFLDKTVKELRSEAKALDVPGRGKMTRGELIAAISARRDPGEVRFIPEGTMASQAGGGADRGIYFSEFAPGSRRPDDLEHMFARPVWEDHRYVVVERGVGKTAGRENWQVVTDRDDPLGLWRLSEELTTDIVGGPPASRSRQKWRAAGFRFYDEGAEEIAAAADLATPTARVAERSERLAVRQRKLDEIREKIGAVDAEEALLLRRQEAAQRGAVTRAGRELETAEEGLRAARRAAKTPEQRASELSARRHMVEIRLEGLRSKRVELKRELATAETDLLTEIPERPGTIFDDLDDVHQRLADAEFDLDEEFEYLLDLIDDMRDFWRGRDADHPGIRALEQLELAFRGTVTARGARKVTGGAGGLLYDVTGTGYYRPSNWRFPEGSPVAGAARARYLHEADPLAAEVRFGEAFGGPKTEAKIDALNRRVDPLVDPTGEPLTPGHADEVRRIRDEIDELIANPLDRPVTAGGRREYESLGEISPADALRRWLRIARQFADADQVVRHEEFRLGGRGKSPESVRAQVRSNLEMVDEQTRLLGERLGIETTGRGIGRGNITVEDLFSQRFRDPATGEALWADETVRRYVDSLEEFQRLGSELEATERRLAELERLRAQAGDERLTAAFREHGALERVAILEAELLNAETADAVQDALSSVDLQFGRVDAATDRLQQALSQATGRDSAAGRAARQARGGEPLEDLAGRLGARRDDVFIPEDSKKGNRIFDLPKRQRVAAQNVLKDALGGSEWGPWRMISGDDTLNSDVMDVVNAFARINDPNEFGVNGEFWNSWDTLQNWLKAGMIATPGFVNRNIFGAFFNAAIDGVNVAAIFTSFKMTRRVANKATEEGTSFIRAARSLAEGDADFERYYQLLQAGVRGGGQAISSVELELGLRNARSMQLLFGGKDGKPVRSVSYKPWSPKFGLFHGVRAVNSWVEDIVRLGVGMDTMRWGGSVGDSLERIAKTQFDYSELTQWERRWAKRIMPFYTWTRKNVPYQLSQLARHPDRYNDILTAKRNLELGTEDEGVVPDYYLEPFGIRLPFAPGGATIYTAPDLPFQDLFRYAGKEGWQGALKQLVSGTSPIIKTPTEAYFGKSIFTGIPFTGRYQQVPRPMASLPLKWLMPVLESQGWAKRAPNGEWKMRDHHIYMVNGLVPTFNQIRRLFPNEERYQRSLIRNLLSTLGGVAVNFNTPEAKISWMQSQRFEAADRRRDIKDVATRRK